METNNKVQINLYSPEERQELILQWKQRGKTRWKFCEEQSLNYYIFGTWIEQLKEKKQATS